MESGVTFGIVGLDTDMKPLLRSFTTPSFSTDARKVPNFSADARKVPNFSTDARKVPNFSTDARKVPNFSTDARKVRKTTAARRAHTSAISPRKSSTLFRFFFDLFCGDARAQTTREARRFTRAATHGRTEGFQGNRRAQGRAV
eukprot:1195728-Prorocentrum_minimum.AAC.8